MADTGDMERRMAARKTQYAEWTWTLQQATPRCMKAASTGFAVGSVLISSNWSLGATRRKVHDETCDLVLRSRKRERPVPCDHICDLRRFRLSVSVTCDVSSVAEAVAWLRMDQLEKLSFRAG